MPFEPKRCWKRPGDGMLVDEWVDPDGTATVRYDKDPVANEADRARRLERVAKGKAGAVAALDHEPTGESLDAMLAGLDAGQTPGIAFVRYADDPRVQPAVLKATDRLDPGSLGSQNALQALGLLGGAGALPVLNRKAHQLAALPETWADDDFQNQAAAELCTACAAILTLDPQNESAAQLVVRIMHHPCSSNRERAVVDTAERLRPPGPGTATARMLERALLKACATDDALFISAAVALHKREPSFEQRAINILKAQTDNWGRANAIGALSRLELSVSPRIAAAIRHSVEQTDDLHHSALLCLMVGAVLSESKLRDVAERALADASPSLRDDGCELLSFLDPKVAASLAEAALCDEPDSAIAARLRIHNFTNAHDA